MVNERSYIVHVTVFWFGTLPVSVADAETPCRWEPRNRVISAARHVKSVAMEKLVVNSTQIKE